MRQVSIEQLRSNISKEMGNLPFEVTRYGEVVATIIKGSHDNAFRFDITKNISTSNNNTKTVSPTGGRLCFYQEDMPPEFNKVVDKIIKGWCPLDDTALAPKA